MSHILHTLHRWHLYKDHEVGDHSTTFKFVNSLSFESTHSDFNTTFMRVSTYTSGIVRAYGHCSLRAGIARKCTGFQTLHRFGSSSICIYLYLTGKTYLFQRQWQNSSVKNCECEDRWILKYHMWAHEYIFERSPHRVFNRTYYTTWFSEKISTFLVTYSVTVHYVLRKHYKNQSPSLSRCTNTMYYVPINVRS